MTTGVHMTRRAFLADLGRGSAAIALLSIAGCGPALSSATARPSGSRAAGPTGRPATSASAAAAASATPATSASGDGNDPMWTRVSLGFVSAYILVRAGEAIVVDTGVVGSDDEIATALGGIGLGWPDVGHVILTHKHSDHAGSIEAVLSAATGATGYAGTADLPAITAPRPLRPLDDGATVAGLTIVGTPGHTLGHISVLDAVNGILVAGDALGTVGGTLAGSNPQFTTDAGLARTTVVKLGSLSFETLLVGHGDPIEGGASEQVKALAGG